MGLIIVWLQVGLQERDDQLRHFIQGAGAWQGLPSPAMATKGRTITIAAEFAQACPNGRILVVQAFDKQMMPVSLRDNLVVAQEGAQLTLQFARVVFFAGGKAGMTAPVQDAPVCNGLPRKVQLKGRAVWLRSRMKRSVRSRRCAVLSWLA